MNMTAFNFNHISINTLIDEQGNPWFIASEICGALDHSDTSKAVSRLDLDEKLLRTMFVSGQHREVLTINESGLYTLIMKSRKPEAKAFQKWVTSEVLPTIRKSGGYSVTKPEKIPFNEAAAGLDIIYRSLNVSESGKLSLFRGLVEDYGVSTNRLPSYAVDAPTVTAGSSEPTISITEMLKRSGLNISPVMANKKLESLGMIRKEYRTSTRGNGVKNFWSVTNEGLKYGKNVVSDRNQTETQPHWYIATMDDLIGLLSE